MKNGLYRQLGMSSQEVRLSCDLSVYYETSRLGDNMQIVK